MRPVTRLVGNNALTTSTSLGAVDFGITRECVPRATSTLIAFEYSEQRFAAEGSPILYVLVGSVLLYIRPPPAPPSHAATFSGPTVIPGTGRMKFRELWGRILSRLGCYICVLT